MMWGKRAVLVAMVGILVLGLAGASVLAEDIRIYRGIVSTEPIGLFSGVINLEYEWGHVDRTFYVWPAFHLAGEESGEESYVDFIAGMRWYLAHTAPEGFWWGPFGRVSVPYVGFGVQAGYKYFITTTDFFIEGRGGPAVYASPDWGGWPWDPDYWPWEWPRESKWEFRVHVGYAF